VAKTAQSFMRFVAVTSILVLAVRILAAQNNPLVPTPQEVVERLWSAATQGELLTPQGWQNAARLFADLGTVSRNSTFTVMSNYYGVNRISVERDTAEVDMECANLGQINSALRFTPSSAPHSAKTSLRYRLVFAPTRLVTYSSTGQIVRESKGISQWQIQDPQSQPFTTVNTAIRYILELRVKIKDPAVRKNADETIAKLLTLH
jgi:hypothetical protein